MKTILFSIIAFSTFITNAQVEEEVIDTTRFKIGNTEFIIINHEDGGADTLLANEENNTEKEWEFNNDKDKKYKNYGHWSGFELGINTLLNKKGGTSFDNNFLEIDPAQSFNFSFNFAELEIPFGTPHIGLITGLGFEHSRYGFKNNNILMSNSDSTWSVTDTTRNFSKNQLRTWYFNVPLLLQINTSTASKKNIHFEMGVIGGVRIGSKTFQKYAILGGDQEDKGKGKYNINPFKLDATARIGYKGVGLFMNYNLLPLFDTNKTELAYPLTVGIRFGG